MLTFFKQTQKLNARHQANQGFKFLVLNGMGVTVYDLSPKEQEFHIHIPHRLTLNEWFHTESTVHKGHLKQPRTALPSPHPQRGTNLCLKYSDGNTSQVLTVDAVFTQRYLTDRFTPNILREWLLNQEDQVCLKYQNITYTGEVPGYLMLIHDLFKIALELGNWTLPIETVFKRSGYHTFDIFENWIDDLVRAELVVTDHKSITIQNSLLYLMMNSINRRHVMSGQIFQY